MLSDFQSLKSSLISHLPCRIPCNPRVFSKESITSSTIFDDSVFEVDDDIGFLVDCFRTFDWFCQALHGDVSEKTVLACITSITGWVWKELFNKYLKDTSEADVTFPGSINQDVNNLVFNFTYNKKDRSASILGTCRPNECEYLNDILVCKSEHKDLASKLSAAKKELACVSSWCSYP